MSKIAQRLSTLFDDHRIIIWYDEGGSLKDEFDSLDIEAKKLEITNNEFGIKVQVLYEDAASKYLIYSPNGEPQREENWLLDIEQSHYKFSADPLSMIISELGLDVSKKALMSEHKAFFGAKSRLERYKSMVCEDDSHEELLLKMMGATLGCDESLEEILLTLIQKKSLLEELEKYALHGELFKMVAKKFKYHATTPTISDLVYKLLQNHFYASVEPSKCELNKEAKLFVKQWMDSSRHKELFCTISAKVQKELGIANLIASYKLENLLECDTYEICEQFVIANLRDRIISQKINQKELEDKILKKEHKFWYERYENIYKTFKYATKLLNGIHGFEADIKGFEDGVNKYVSLWWENDYNYRKFSYYFSKSEHKEIVKPLEIVEDAYLNSYLRVLNDKWQEFVEHYSLDAKNHQRNFYKTKVSPIVQKGQKAFVIISDAMRYECAKEFAKIISYENTSSRSFVTQESYMVSSLPSYTQLGMASLLPHRELEIKSTDDTVFADGKSTKGKDARTKILQSVDPASLALNDEEFLALSRDDGREMAKANNVIYIYHNQIDATGDDAISEDKVFEAVASSFETIKKIVKQIANLNGTNIFLTSDHGFIYTNKVTQESEFCKIDTTFMEASKVNRRFIIGKNLENSPCTQKFSSNALGLSGDNEFLITKSINKIRKQGGGNRFVHGGASLQEIIIPLLEIKYQRKNVVGEVEVNIMPIATVTTNSINVSLYQEQPIDDKIKPITLIVGFFGEDGVELSDKHKVSFDSSDSENRNRERKIKFSFKEIANRYNNGFIKLVMKKELQNSSEEPIYKTYDVKLQLSFFNDFDEL